MTPFQKLRESFKNADPYQKSTPEALTEFKETICTIFQKQYQECKSTPFIEFEPGKNLFPTPTDKAKTTAVTAGALALFASIVYVHGTDLHIESVKDIFRLLATNIETSKDIVTGLIQGEKALITKHLGELLCATGALIMGLPTGEMLYNLSEAAEKTLKKVFRPDPEVEIEP